MTKNEVRILRILYQDPTQVNNTNESLVTSLGIKESVFDDTIKSLSDYGYIWDCTDEGQKMKNLTAYKITIFGAKAFKESESTSLIKKYGNGIIIVIGGLGLVGVFFQIKFGIRDGEYTRKQIQIQEQQYNIQLQQIQQFEEHKTDRETKNATPDSSIQKEK